MSRAIRRPAALLAFGLAAALGLHATAPAQDPLQKTARKFMRQKLDYAQKILEGLSLEDYEMIAKNARALRQLSEDSQWKFSPSVNYTRHSAEFQALADELAQQAKEKDLDGATLAYVRLTINCVNCHKVVRDL